MIQPQRPSIVCLCGSTRFMGTFAEQNRRLTLEGKIVLSVGAVTTDSAHATPLDAATKRKLDVLHLRKIDLADAILVLNVGGYLGESTLREIEYAVSTGKIVRYLEPSPSLFRDA